MNSSFTFRSENKENQYPHAKPNPPPQIRRAFATDITNAILNPDADTIDQHNPVFLGEYAKDIFSYLHSVESHYLPAFGYMAQQPDVNEKMRSILVDWLIEVHFKFKLSPDSIYLSVNLLDRYLEKHPVPRHRLQLVGVTSLMIACKYEEIIAPEVKDYVYITDNAYTYQEVLDMEKSILRALDFDVTVPTAYTFLMRYNRLQGGSESVFYLAQYSIELGLVEYQMLRYSPALFAGSALYLANRMLGAEPWPKVLQSNSPFKEHNLKECAKDLFLLMQCSEKSSLQAVKKKFSQSKYLGVSQIRPQA
mmetsp:Transcript_7195/g.10629  ORF Transcript_7195/g.10629 Transcript_7195/m.10629 type:complete len:307 (+) Transcript_7195:41-961(+)